MFKLSEFITISRIVGSLIILLALSILIFVHPTTVASDEFGVFISAGALLITGSLFFIHES